MMSRSVDRQRRHRRAAEPFQGFEQPGANFLYCPNQFFDVCLPNCSRGAVRLVAYVLRRTLGWLDKDGNPIEQNIDISYQDLVTEAGISRGAIRAAIDEAIAGGFIRCTRVGRANSSGRAAQSASYMLRWDAGRDYVKAPEAFAGFYAGEGHRSPIPNAFFDQIIPFENLSVAKVVGTVLRHTIGYQNQFGGRRSQAPLSFSYIQKYTRISDRSTLSQAVHHAVDKGYIRCVDRGCFHASIRQRRAAAYAVRWLAEAKSESCGSETRPAKQSQFKNQTSDGSRTRPAKRSKNQTKEKTLANDTFKQQHASVPAAVAAENLEAYRLLRDVGFDEPTANKMARLRTAEEIEHQIAWLNARKPETNRLGLLRRAIEENWSAPHAVQQTEKQKLVRERERQREAKQAAEEERRQAHEQRRRERWFALSVKQRAEFRQAAIDKEHPRTRSWLEKQTIDVPAKSFLIEMDNVLDRAL